MQRWVKFAKFLPSLGWTPVVYTPENPEMTSVDESLLADIDPGLELIKAPILEPYGVYRKLTAKGSKDATKTEVNPINGGKKSFKQKLALFVRANLFLPDPRVWWVRPSVKRLRRYLEEHPVDAIITTGPPHSMHLIGRRLSAATGIPWVADFRDPWTRMFYFKHLPLAGWARRWHERMEQRVLDEAAAVIAVTPFVQRDFQDRTSTRVEMITNGFDESDFQQEVVPDGRFNITHTGLFASDGIPDVLWDVLKDMCSEDPAFQAALRIRLVGKTDKEVIDSLEQRGLGANVVNCGYLGHKDAVREQMNASMLILPLRKDPEYRKTLPGKVFEYIASRRPVLGIGQEDGAMAQIVRETQAGATCDWNNKESMRAFVQAQWERHKAGEWEFSASGIERYTRQSTARQVADLLDSIVKK